MKTLHTFTLPKEVEVEKTEESVNEQGEQVKITKKVKETTLVRFAIKRPTRALFDEGDLFYSISISEGITKGLITRALLTKRISNDGGLMSEPDKELYIKLYNEMYDKMLELQKLSTLKEENDENKKKTGVLAGEIAVIRNRLQAFEASQASLFEHTAEARARNRTILWWVLQLAYMGEEGKETPLFEGETHSEKTKAYEKVEEKEDPVLQKALEKFVFYVTLWYSGSAANSDDFIKLEKELE